MIRVRVGTAADAPLAARLHVSEISEGFLPTLGQPFLETLYRRIVRSPRSFLLIAERDLEQIGFVAGTEDVRALYTEFLWHDGFSAARAALPRVVRSSRRVLETLRYGVGGHSGAEKANASDASAAELLAIAVAPDERGHGAGHALVDAFTGELSVRRVPRARVVVGADNAPAIALYQRSGFNPTETIEVHRGTASQVLTWP
ncbi:MAG TPA: GNAT family N-acetyltransferase [Acidimicrobiia bacterium]|jgi:ribosomal protein S18 acetylase RimI-like enzyme|nr:GNAT family N-acetyltransferase [Acidimicrobiia bacterium]